MKKALILILVIILSSTAEEPIKKSGSLNKPAVDDPLISRARAYLDKGKLKIAVHNFGRFCGVEFPEGQWGNFTYIPDISLIVGVPGKDKAGNNYPWAVGKKDMYLIREGEYRSFGNESTYWGPTVSESWMDRTFPNYNRTDWESLEQSQIYFHNPLATAGEFYGQQGLYTDPEDQYPLISSSDVPDSWPLTTDAQGNEVHFWPGPYALDPADTLNQKQLEGVFVSDQDIYFEFDDRFATRDIDTTQGYSIGIRATVSAYSYAASISEDIIFFKMNLHNESNHHYEGVYAGFYFDGDAYNTDINGFRYDDSNLGDMMGYNTGLDYGYIYDKNNGADYPIVSTLGEDGLAYTAVKLLDTPVATETVDLTGDGFPNIQVGDDLGLTGWHWFDWYFRPGAADVPNVSYSGDGQTPYRPNKEEIQYKIMAGDTSNLDGYDDEHYFHPVKIQGPGGIIVDGPLNPRFDSIDGLELEFPDGLDCVFIMSSGPFSIAPGDSVPFSFCVIMGADTTDLRLNAEIAQLMYDNNYQGARSPKAPKVIAKEEDERVTLYWDAVSVSDKDIITGYEDFEGYRIYKSSDNGKTWGQEIYDEQTRTSYYVPLAQMDLENHIEGFDKVPPHRLLGENTGIQFRYEDNNVSNGVEYLYAVCAYDRGFIPGDPGTDPDNVGESEGLTFEIPSIENLLSPSTILDHIVRAIPHRPASNTSVSELEVKMKEGTIGNGIFNVEVISPSEMTGHDYEILFDCRYSDPPENTQIIANSQRFTIIDMVSGDTLVKESDQWAKDSDTNRQIAPPVYDGLRWGVQMSSDIIVQPEDAFWTPSSYCTYKLATATLSRSTRSNYEIRFLGEDAEDTYNFTGQIANGKVPFQVWNTVTNKKVIIVNPTSREFAPTVNYFIRESELPEPSFSGLTPPANTMNFSFDWVLPGEVDEDDNPIPPDRDWELGDTLIVPVRKPFERGDGFTVATNATFQIEKVTQDNIKNVKVVPNPFIVHAEWETDDFVRRLQFTNLPDNCKIHIYTVAAERVITLHHSSSFDGSENWDLLTSNRQDAAPGLYIYVVEAENGETHTGKFVIIK